MIRLGALLFFTLISASWSLPAYHLQGQDDTNSFVLPENENNHFSDNYYSESEISTYPSILFESDEDEGGDNQGLKYENENEEDDYYYPSDSDETGENEQDLTSENSKENEIVPEEDEVTTQNYPELAGIYHSNNAENEEMHFAEHRRYPYHHHRRHHYKHRRPHHHHHHVSIYRH